MEQLLDFPGGHPYSKFDGIHWRLVEMAELVRLGVPSDPARCHAAVEVELAWLTSADREVPPQTDPVRPRWHAAQDGNAIYAITVLGHGADERVGELVGIVLAKQWPDGGWNCDRKPMAHRSSFHESVTTALGLARYAQQFSHPEAAAAAARTAELLLQHRLFRRSKTGEAIHSSWTVPHYPPYWHYDVLQGLRLLDDLGLLDDPRADDAKEVLAGARVGDGFKGRSWSTATQPAAVSYGRPPRNSMLNQRAHSLLTRG
ncbi:hypothetical protein [Nocardia puris]|uniref:hypothetical protein n=1 Tax=Nocardia puris TaxID=208602 RepID=UPI002E21E087